MTSPTPPATSSNRDAPIETKGHRRSPRWIAVILGVAMAMELVGLSLLKWPECLRFEGFAFSDWGANLSAQDLIDRGIRPGVGFSYPYGLLPLAVGRAWFAVMGRTPGAYIAAVIVCEVLLAVALARFLAARRVGWRGVSLAIVAIPMLVPPTQPNLSHAIETVLLAFALAEHARGARGRSLALAVAAAMTKPSMAYLYGAVLLVAIGRDAIEHRRHVPIGRAIATALGPAVCVGLVLLVTLGAVFGLESLVTSLLPLESAEHYEIIGYGFFFGSGRLYWRPPGAGWRDYVGAQRGFWLAGNIVLTIGGAVALVRWLIARSGPGRDDRIGDEVIATCAMLHAAFVTLFYASPLSWSYYGFLLLMGLVALVDRLRGRLGAVVALVLIGQSLLALRALPGEVQQAWRTLSPDPRTAGLWSTAAMADEWAIARRLCQGRDAALLSWAGCGELLFPEFGPPPRFFLLPGIDHAPDIARMADRLRKAEVIVVPTAASQPFRDHLLDRPAFRHALTGARPVFQGEFIAVLARDRQEAE